jgi:putative Holliday junction resolvase
VALANFELGQARALQVLRDKDGEARIGQLAQLVTQWAPALLVLGLPLDREGREQAQSRRVRRFAVLLSARLGLPVVLHDERWSTAAAEADLRAAGQSTREVAQRGDAEAAREILQGFLDARQAQRARLAAPWTGE